MRSLVFVLFVVYSLHGIKPVWGQDFFRKEIIGRSALNNDIVAYHYGKGSKKILVFGASHGDELNSVRMVQYIMHQVQNKKVVVPNNISLIFVPMANPDGFLYINRMNANGIDLNRNFPAKDWKRKVYVSGYVLKKGGGRYAGSEPETKAFVNLIKREKPLVSISYHSRAGYIYPAMKDPYSKKLAKIYEQGSGIKAMFVSWSATVYPVTGGYSGWLYSLKNHSMIMIEHKQKYTIDAKELAQNFQGFQSIVRHLTNKK